MKREYVVGLGSYIHMLLDRETFNEVREDTLACLLRHPQLFFKYATGAVRDLLGIIEDAEISDDDSIELTLSAVNEQLSVLRGIPSFYPRLKAGPTVTLLRSWIGELADVYASIHAVRGFEVSCHTPTEATKSMPVSVDTFNESAFSESLEVGRIADSVVPFMGVGSGYISGTYVATLLGGTVEPLQEIGRDKGGESLKSFIDGYTGDPLALYVDGTKYTLYPSLVLDASHDQFLASVDSWVARTERVTFSSGVGHTGGIFSYTAGNTLYELSEYLRVGDVLSSQPHVRVKEVLGYRISLSSPTVIDGEALFHCEGYVEWAMRASAFGDLTLQATLTRDRVDELQAKLTSLQRSVTPLSRTGGSPKEGTALDIKDGHYNVGANHAYNILERGRFNEYSKLTENEASTSKLLSETARVLKAGSLL